ncbi:MAG: hypothetical protein V7L11_19265 [Nostoc sp.]
MVTHRGQVGSDAEGGRSHHCQGCQAFIAIASFLGIAVAATRKF